MRICLLLAGLLLAAAPGARAEETVPVRRTVIALVEGRAPDPASENSVHQVLELPLNHLGMVVRHHYLGSGGPPPDGQEDGTVAFEAARIDAPDTEFVVFNSGHSTQSHALTIQEVRRILREALVR